MSSPDAHAPVFLIGFMASGKTTVGRLLAAALGFRFADLDDQIVAAAGATIPEIFAREGEAGFRAKEREAVRAATGERRVVFATGGGAPCFGDNLATMRGAGRVVALEVSPEEAVRRAGRGSGRPLLDGAANPVDAAAALLNERSRFYAQAEVRVRTEGRAPDAIVAEIVERLGLARAGAAGGSAT
jgi:shikimate kinase